MALFDKNAKKNGTVGTVSLEERINLHTRQRREYEEQQAYHSVNSQLGVSDISSMAYGITDGPSMDIPNGGHTDFEGFVPVGMEQSQLEFPSETAEDERRRDEAFRIEEEVVAMVRSRIKKMFGDRITTEKKEKEFQNAVWEAIDRMLMDEGQRVKTVDERARIRRRIYNLIMGLGPLELLFDKGYSEIMVARYDKIFVEEKGKMILSDVKFASEQELRVIIDQILAPLGRVIDDSHPTVDGRLEDGSRFNAVIPPIAVDGTQLTIRRFPEKKITEEDYLKFGSLNEDVLQFLKAGVESRWNMIVSGGTGSGKTTLLNLLSNFYCFEPGLSVVTIEDSCELKINHPNVRRYETRNANASGAGEVSAKMLVKNAMRIRPDVIIVGEIRDGVMADFLRLTTSGHDGCLTTVHNNSPREMEQTVQVLFQMAQDYDFTENAISRLYCAGVDVIVQIKRCADHVRRITHVTHVVGYGDIGAEALGISHKDARYNPNKCYLKDIFVWEPWGVNEDGTFKGDYVPTGYVPRELLDKARDHKVHIDESIFVRKQKEYNFKTYQEEEV